jgi:phage terminase small subunit
MDKYGRIKNKVKKFLKDKGSYEPIDDVLIGEMVYNIELCDMAKVDIAERGIQVNIRPADSDPLMQINQAVSIYSQASKQVVAISTKLGITVLNRTQLGLESAAKDDALDSIISK